MNYYFSIENDEGEVIYETVSPTWEMLEEKYGAWERSQKTV